MGSSPLARGLHSARTAGIGRWRIIPARAGFTADEGEAADDSGDHPRSRGVYRGGGVGRHGVSGSSPLARGLLRHRLPRLIHLRIIPARAGFTRIGSILGLVSGDHPRSRGVYSPRPSATPPATGSSPLARGLPCPTTGMGAVSRIIPARAGFTANPPYPACRPTDHPRSRGVYSDVISKSSPEMGSSPLARGLRNSFFSRILDRGIIPARAGFTG